MDPLAVLVSLGFVVGLGLAVSGAPRVRRPRLGARLDPYLRGLEPAATRLLDGVESPLTPVPGLERLLKPLLHEGARLVERWLGGSAAVARRLREAGLADDVGRFRAEQVLWGLGGFVIAVLVTFALPIVAGRSRPWPWSAGRCSASSAGCSVATDGWAGRSPGGRHGCCGSCPPWPTCSAWR